MSAKSILKTIFLPLLVVSSLTSCGGGGGDDSTVTTVKFSVRNYQVELEGWQEMVKSANQLLAADNQKVKIELETIKVGSSWDDFYTKVTTNILTRKGGTIGRIAESHIPLMIKKNQIADLTDVANELIATNEYNNDSFGGVALNGGKYYGLPSGLQHMVLYYNKDKFDAYNSKVEDADKISYPSGDWDDASTFTEIRDYAKKLTSGSGASKQYGFSAGPFLAYAGMYSKNCGGYNIFDDEGNCQIDTEPFYDVYNWLGSMIIEDGSAPKAVDTYNEGGFGKFCSGNIAMLVDGIYNLHDIIRDCKFKVGIAAIPVGVNDSGAKYKSYSTNFTDRYWAAQTSKHPAEDKIALKYILKAESIRAHAALQVGGVPIRKDCVDTYFTSIVSSGVTQEAANVIKEGAKNTINVPYSSYYNEVDQKINAVIALWMDQKEGWTTEKFIKYMDSEMKAAMGK